MSNSSQSPYPLVEQIASEAQAAGKASVRYDIFIDFGGSAAVDALSQAWGKALGNPKAAPGWKTTKEFAEMSDARPVASIAVSESGAGAIAMSLPDSAKSGIAAFREELLALAREVSTPEADIQRAAEAFDAVAARWEFSKPFTQESASLVSSEFLSSGGDAFERFEMDGFGAITPEQILKMAATSWKTEADSEQAASGAKKYRSLGQMVKAGDAEALTDYISQAKSRAAKGEAILPDGMADQLLWHAAEMGHADAIRVLVEQAEASLSYRDKSGITPLLAACFNGHDQAIEQIIQLGANINEPDPDGRTAVMLAAEMDKAPVIHKLASLGADLDATTLDGRTALHFACAGAEEKTANAAVLALIEAGANPTLRDMIENTYPEELIDEESDTTYAALAQYRKDWESGAIPSKKSSIVSKTRAALGI